MKESSLEKTLNGTNKFFDNLNRFYGTRAKTWYGELAKNLVPGYTINRTFDGGFFSDMLVAGGFAVGMIETAKVLGYCMLIKETIGILR